MVLCFYVFHFPFFIFHFSLVIGWLVASEMKNEK